MIFDYYKTKHKKFTTNCRDMVVQPANSPLHCGCSKRTEFLCSVRLDFGEIFESVGG